MVVPRGVLPLLLAGSTGLALVGAGVTGLSGLDPTLRRAAADVQRQEQRQRPVVPDVAPDVPGGGARSQLVDCPDDHAAPSTAAGKV